MHGYNGYIDIIVYYGNIDKCMRMKTMYGHVRDNEYDCDNCMKM